MSLRHENICHDLTMGDLQRAIYQYLQGLSEEMRPKNPYNIALVYLGQQLEDPGTTGGRELLGELVDPVIMQAIETRYGE